MPVRIERVPAVLQWDGGAAISVAQVRPRRRRAIAQVGRTPRRGFVADDWFAAEKNRAGLAAVS
jgi:hypothetical protein